MYAITHSGFEYSEFVYKSNIDFIVAASPVLWIFSFIVFNSLIIKAVRTTHTGYRLSTKRILVGSVGVSIVLGVSGYFIDEIFEIESVIRYPVRAREEQIWLSPQEGRINGLIEKKYISGIVIRDKNNVLWDVDMSGFNGEDFPFVEEGKSVRIVGTSTINGTTKEGEENTFTACAVFPWEIGGSHRKILKPLKMGHLLQKPPFQNKNPDCKLILNDIRKQVRLGERK